jgi:small-conductance mechanosensitive channel
MEGSMSFSEKSIWLSSTITLIAYVGYWWIILGQARSVPITEVSYGGVMLASFGALVVAAIVGHIAVVIVSPKEADKKDQRDRDINRHGDAIGYYVLSLAVLLVLILTMTKAAHFWIAHAIHLACTVATLWTAIVKILAYRRGFWV